MWYNPSADLVTPIILIHSAKKKVLLNLLLEVSLSALLLLILNFVFNDYLDLKFLWKVGKDKIMDMF